MSQELRPVWMRGLVWLALVLGFAGSALAGDFTWCLGDRVFCTESAVEAVGSSCGESFYFARGRISSPVLSGLGTVTVAIKSCSVSDSYSLPVYVELVPTDSCSTRGRTVRFFLLEVRSSTACGGVWESIGPLKLAHYVTPGTSYTIQLTFLDGDPPPFARSAAVSCLHVTTSGDTPVAAVTWGDAKQIFR